MKKSFAVVMAAMMAAGMMTGCSSKPQETTAAATEAETTAEETTAAETEAESKEEAKADLGEQSILVAAAASLKNAYEDELIPMFEEQYPGVTVEGTYDSSGKLQTQIEEGADADVFFSAAMKQMNALEDEGLLVSRGTVGRFVTSDEAALERARRTARQDALEKLAEDAQAAGLTLDDLVQYIREEAQSAAIPSDDPDPHV